MPLFGDAGRTSPAAAACGAAVHEAVEQSPAVMALPRIGDIEVAQDLKLQALGWRVQRVGWACMALAVIAAAAGLFGSGGPASRATAATENGALRADYARFARRQAPQTLRLHFGAEAVRGGEVTLWFERAYVERMVVEQVVPEPQRVSVGPERLTYRFAADGPGMVSFHVRFDGPGIVRGRAGTGAAALELRHVVYP